MITSLLNLKGNTEPILIQIISHGNCDGFGINMNEFVKYSEISDILREINSSAKNNLVLNLMTICCSIHQLSFFNQGTNKLYKNLIGSTQGAPFRGAILHSSAVNTLDLMMVAMKIEDLNYNLNDDYSIECPETFTYLLL